MADGEPVQGCLFENHGYWSRSEYISILNCELYKQKSIACGQMCGSSRDFTPRPSFTLIATCLVCEANF